MTGRRPSIEDALVERFRSAGGPDEWDLSRARDLLAVLESSGAITCEMAHDWRARFGRLAAGPYGLPQRDQTVLIRAREHLERLLTEVGAEPDPERRLAVESVASAVPRGLAVVGALSQEDWDVFAAKLYPDDSAEIYGEPLEGWAELIRVLPGPRARRAGLRITLVELYAAGVVLRWESVAGSQVAIAETTGNSSRGWALSDEQGTRYEVAGSGGGGGAATVSHGYQGFSPAVPDDVKRIRLQTPEAAFDLGLA